MSSDIRVPVQTNGVVDQPVDTSAQPMGALPRPRPRKVAAPAAGAPTLRVITANVQSFPENAITLDQALEDLRRNAEVGDIVLLQEIVPRYRPLVEEAFAEAEWEVFYGRNDNSEPIAFRRSQFTKVAGRVTLLHPARPGAHGRRYTTHLRLTCHELGFDFHVTNVHFVSSAFKRPAVPDQAIRIEEWREGIARHLAIVESLVASGLPVLGGGDYNCQLRRQKSVGAEVAGRPVTYAVDPASIDLLWFVNGKHAMWKMRSKRLYGGRDGKNPQRNSDHGAREAVITLSAATPERPAPKPTPKKVRMPGPFELTEFGDSNPKTVDWKTRAALEEAERRLGYLLTVVQGSYNGGGVSASAGTHDRGGVVDLLAWDWKRKVRVLRAVGFAAWYRPAVSGLWGAHIHAVLIDHGRLADSAGRQVEAYRNRRDGLKGNRLDTFWRPKPIPVFEYPPPARATTDEPDPDPPVQPLGTAYPPKRTLDGVDTSHHQSGRIDLKAARAAGLRWWYVKATEGTTFRDDTYEKRIRQARKAGIPVGSYHFARPDGNDAAQEAAFFLEHTDIRTGDMLPMLDLETMGDLSLTELTAWTGTWVSTVKRELGSKGLVGRPIIYTRFNLNSGFGCLLWVARYSNDFRAPAIPKPWRRAAIWQHSDGKFGPIQHVPGFGAVDVNALHPDVPLSALRVKPRVRTRPQAAPRDDVDAMRQQLQAAADSIQAALDSLPKR